MLRKGVLGVFADAARAADAVRTLRTRGHHEVFAIMPAPFPEVMDALGKPKSRLGWVTLVGAVSGTACGFALCIATSQAWPLLTSGKPIVSIPPFVIIAFELAVLAGALATLTALALWAYVGTRQQLLPHEVRFSTDRIGVFAGGAGCDDAEIVLRAAGAEEVRRVA